MNRFENRQMIQKTSQSNDSLVMFALIWIVFSKLFFFVLLKINVEFFESDLFRNINILFSIVWGFIPLLLALSIKDKTKQGFFLILAAIYIVITIYEQIQDFV
ncbi:hypothetical protein [uncultured Dokdonia sp.]|uniref:hypothetical protein n=1 Tax=uncultured Dokdonia sp. TaxID=575653 RepID=UPI00260DEC8C|nr:hypothetical protein [uncultured Dokdonia sp.]